MARRKTAAFAAFVVAVVAVAIAVQVWMYLLPVLAICAAGTLGWRLWRRDRAVRQADRRWRHQDAVQAGHRTLAEADRMTGTQFEQWVAVLCRRDGCAEVRNVGGAGDNGADILGRLPDGRRMVVQCKRYAPRHPIPAKEIRDLMGALQHHGGEVGIFVTTSRFTAQATALCRQHGIWAIHRDLLGLWNTGAHLTSLAQINGAGQGDRRHRTRWTATYGR